MMNKEKKGNKETLSDRVQALLDEEGLRAADLCRIIEMPESTLRYILRGNTKRTSPNNVKKIADFFGVSMEYLIGGKPLKEKPKQATNQGKDKLFLIPVLKIIDVKTFLANKKSIPYPADEDWIPVSDYVSKEAFCVQVDYKDKNAFVEGSALIVDPKKSWDIGSYVLVSINRGKPTVKRIFQDGDDILFESVGIKAVAIKKTENDNIFGPIIEARKRFE